jgi:hypothetical protein
MAILQRFLWISNKYAHLEIVKEYEIKEMKKAFANTTV